MNFFEKIYSKFFDKAYMNQKISYAQCGEDLIVDFLLTWILKIENPCYLDIGAHHPFNLNNTYLFYKKGSTGVNIEPDPDLIKPFFKYRPLDINLNTGVGFKNNSEWADFYIMGSKTLNTFSKSEAFRMQDEEKVIINEVKKLELINVNSIFKSYFDKKEIDFLSMDVEGLDFDILKSINFNNQKPKVICVETIEFSIKKVIKKNEKIVDFLLDTGYLLYADTSINSIFVRKDLLEG